MGKVIVLSGCSGSGKTTYADRIIAENPKATCVSADHFFEADGHYNFDPTKLGQAHGRCFRRFVTMLQDGNYGGNPDTIVVANTNQSTSEISPYMLAAEGFGWQAEIVTLDVDPAVAAARNVHGVPAKKVAEQAARISRRTLPGYWKQRVISC